MEMDPFGRFANLPAHFALQIFAPLNAAASA
jgi:hypothetical protein